jgi:hypothetical protein
MPSNATARRPAEKKQTAIDRSRKNGRQTARNYQELYGVLSNGDSLSEEELTSLMP